MLMFTTGKVVRMNEQCRFVFVVIITGSQRFTWSLVAPHIWYGDELQGHPQSYDDDTKDKGIKRPQRCIEVSLVGLIVQVQLTIAIMPEGSLSVAKVISTTLKKIRYGRKMNSRKDLDNEKMEVRNVIERQEIELQRCWEGKLVFVLHNVFTKKVKTWPVIIMTLLYVHCDCMNNFWKTIELACNCLDLYRFSYQEHALFINVCFCFAGMLTNDKRFWT